MHMGCFAHARAVAILFSSTGPSKSHTAARDPRRRLRIRRGVAAAEFAIVLPVFLLLMMGLLEFGRMIMVQQVLTNASREGARHAALAGATACEVQGTVDAYLATATVQGATVNVNPTSLGSAPPGSQVSVAVTVPFEQVSWMPPWFSSGVTLSASSLMRREGIP